jgi:flagellar P-ring protein precursor FlgI
MYIKFVYKVIINFCFYSCILFNVASATRIKDIAIVQGVRDNFIQGYGLVTGLPGTGDNLQNSVFTKKEFKNFLSKFNVDVDFASLKSKNVAGVIVNATLPSFARPGRRIDVKVSAIGDATSISGGVLLPTPLIGPDGNVYAIAQGTVQVQKFIPITKDVRNKTSYEVTTNGWVDSGAIVEVGLDYKIDSSSNLKVVINYPDFSTAAAVAEAINNNIVGKIASPLDSATVLITIPQNRKNDVIKLISEVEGIEVKTDGIAKVIINEATGTIVMGSFVRVMPIAVSHGNIMIDISSSFINQKNITTQKYKKASKALDQLRGTQITSLDESVSLQDLVAGLNRFGVLPKDLIDILKSIKDAGALNAIIEVK